MPGAAAIRRLAACLFVAACLVPRAHAQAEHVVTLTDTPPYMTPPDLDIQVGDTIVWRNDGPEMVHTVADRTLDLYSEDIPVGTEFRRRFDRAGVFPYACYRHHFMRGNITVHNPDGSTEYLPEHAYQVAFTEYPLPTPKAGPRIVIPSKTDDRIWFTEGGGGFYGFEDMPPQNKLGVISAEGRITEYATPTADGTRPSDIGVDSLVMDAQGRIWFTERLADRIGMLAPDGSMVERPLPREGAYPLGIDLDAAGNVWFAERYGNRIGRFTPDGALTEFELPEPDSEPRTVFVDSRQRVWYTARTANEIGYLDPDTGAFHRIGIPTENARPTGIAETSNGDIWFIEMVGNKLAKVQGDRIVEFPIPTPFAAAFKIAVDPGDDLWFTEVFGNAIARFDPDTGAFSEYVIPTPDSRPGGVSVDGKGRVWFTEQAGNKIGMFDPSLLDAEDSASEAPAPEEPPEQQGAVYPVHDFPLPTPGAGPDDAIVEGPEGWLWFSERNANAIGAFDPRTGTFREVALPTPASMPSGVAIDAAGVVWASQFRSGSLARLDPRTGDVQELELPYPNPLPSDVVVDAEGGVWVALSGANAVTRLDPVTGSFAEVALPSPGNSPVRMAWDPSGAVWFTLCGASGSYLARVDAKSHALSLFPMPRAAAPHGLMVDGDQVWVAQVGAASVARFDVPSATWTEFPAPMVDAHPVGIARGPEGRIWVTDGGGLGGPSDRLLVLDPQTGAFDVVTLAGEGAKPRGIVTTARGEIWFTQRDANVVSRVHPHPES